MSTDIEFSTLEMTPQKRRELLDEKRLFLGYGVNLLKSYTEVFDSDKDEVEVWLQAKKRAGHALVVGTTGSGKTVFLSSLVRQDIIQGNRVIYVDPKGDADLFKTAISYAKLTGRFNPKTFMFLSPLYLDVSVSLNPLWGLAADEAASVLVSAIPEGREPFFKKVSFMVLLAIMLALKGENPNFYPSILDVSKYFSLKKLVSLRDMVESILKEIRDAGDDEFVQYSQDAALVLDHIIKTDESYFEKISMTLKSEIDILTTGSLGRVLGQARGNVLYERLANNEDVIFLAYLGALRYGDEIVGRGARMLFSSVQRLTGRMYQYFEKFDPALSIYGDEAKNLFYDGIEDLFNKVRGANVYLTFATQSLGDIAAALGADKMFSILGNTNIQVYMRANDKYTMEYVENTSDEVFVYRPNFLQHQLGLNQIRRKAILGPYLKKLPTGAFYANVYGEWYQLYMPYETVPEKYDFDPAKVFFDVSYISRQSASQSAV